MARAPFQVLIVPYRIKNGQVEYCIFNRSDIDMWQFVSGGGEDSESSLDTAVRELYEETKIKQTEGLFQLKTISSIPSNCFKEIMINYPDVYVVPEYTFAVEINEKIVLSHEHNEYKWVDYQTAVQLLKFDSNKTAIYELSMLLNNL